MSNVNVQGSVDLSEITANVSSDSQKADLLAAAKKKLDALPLDRIPDPPVDPALLPDDFCLPFLHNPNFFGRETELLCLARLLKSREKTAIGPIAIVTGIRGVGKTQLAAEFAHRYGQFFVGGVFWLSFADPGAIAENIANCGKCMNLWSSPSQLSLEAKVKVVLSKWNNALPRLFIFDDCDDEALLVQWLQWLTKTGGSRVLVTSHRGEWSPSLGIQPLHLKMLDRADSIALLQRYCPNKLPRDDPNLEAIAAELGDLPLALHLAGNFLYTYRYARSDIPSVYLSQLREQKLDHCSLQGRGTKFSLTNHDTHVWRTFAVSYNQLKAYQATDAIAIALLARAAQFAPGEPIPRSLLAETADTDEEAELEAELQVQDGIARLLELGLLESTADETLLIHCLLAYFADGVVGEKLKTEAQKAVEGVIVTNTILSPASLLSVPIHLRAILNKSFERYMAMRDYENAVWTQLLLDPYLERWGEYQLMAQRHKQLQDQYKLMAPKLKMRSLVNLGNAYINLAEYQKTVTHYDMALKIARNNAPSEMGAILGSIGNCYLSTGEIEKAIDYYKKAKAHTRKQKEQKNRLLEAKWLNNLGYCYLNKGQIDLAIEHFELAYGIVQEISDQRSEQTISNQVIKQDIIVGCLNNLAYCYSLRGEIEYSIEQYGKVLAIARDNGDIKVQALCHGNLGVCYAELTEFEQVHNHLQQALELSRDFKLMDVTSEVLHSWAEVSVDEENYEQAIKYANEGLEIGKKLGSPRLVSENSSILALAYLYSDRLDYAQTAISEALKQNVLLDLHYILALQGVILLRKEDLSAASQAFKEARQQALYSLDNNTRDYRALDTQCLALCGLTLCEHRNYSAEASNFYRKARVINCSPGIIKHFSDLFNQLVKADARTLLTEIQMVLESYAASGS